MQHFRFEDWDHGRLRVNESFSRVLRANKLTSFDAIQALVGGRVVKNLRSDRITTRHVLRDGVGEQVFYLKMQAPPPLKDYIKPLLRVRWPRVGAWYEWEAMVRFHQAGIPTMVPVALGRLGRSSFVLTLGLEGFQKVSDWAHQHLRDPQAADLAEAAQIARSIGRVTRAMHGAGMYHQDFYLGHLLLPAGGGSSKIYVIDLGRVLRRTHWVTHWVVKDLAQLNYSARLVRNADRLRLMRAYLDRPLQSHDKVLIRKVLAKSRSIARHTQKHGL